MTPIELYLMDKQAVKRVGNAASPGDYSHNTGAGSGKRKGRPVPSPDGTFNESYGGTPEEIAKRLQKKKEKGVDGGND